MKKIHTDRYIHFTSVHHPGVKLGVINCLAKRAQRVCTSNDELGKEKNHLKAFKHLRRMVTLSSLYEHSHQAEKSEKRKRGDAWGRKEVTPLNLYLTSKDCLRDYICKQKGMRTVFKHFNTLRQQLMHVKSRHKNGDKGIVYQIHCLTRLTLGRQGDPSV